MSKKRNLESKVKRRWVKVTDVPRSWEPAGDPWNERDLLRYLQEEKIPYRLKSNYQEHQELDREAARQGFMPIYVPQKYFKKVLEDGPKLDLYKYCKNKHCKN